MDNLFSGLSIYYLSRKLHPSGWRGIESSLLLLNLFIFSLFVVCIISFHYLVAVFIVQPLGIP